MRSQRASDVDVQPGENGHVRVRLRSRGEARPAGPSVWRRLARPLPLIGVLLVVVALVGYWWVYSATTQRTPVLVAAHDLQAGSVVRPSDVASPAGRGTSATPPAEVRG